MGCKPSKNSQVTTNIVPSQNLQKESKASMEAKTEEVANTMPNCKDEEKEDVVIEDVKVKEMDLSATNEEEGKFIAPDSPDSYFSSRKDEVVEGVTTSVEYWSNTEGPNIDAVEMKKGVPVGEDGEKKKKREEEEEDGESNSSGSADLKERVLVTEKECEATSSEKKNVREEEEEKEKAE